MTTESSASSADRRAFLGGLTAVGAVALAGCTIRVSERGVTWETDDGTSSAGTTPTTTETPTPENPFRVDDPVYIEPGVITVADPEPTNRFAIDGMEMQVAPADDGGGPYFDTTLELYGEITVVGGQGHKTINARGIDAGGTPIRNGHVVRRPRDNPIEITIGQTVALNFDAYVDFDDLEGFDPTGNASIGINVRLIEADSTSADDVIPEQFRVYPVELDGSEAIETVMGVNQSQDPSQNDIGIKLYFTIAPVDEQ